MSKFLRRHSFRWALCTLIVVAFEVLFPPEEAKPTTRHDLIEDGVIGGAFTLGIGVISTIAG